jgi:hypothetical protein
MVCATIIFFDETLEKYKLLYRDGTDEWVTAFRIDEELAHSEGYTLEHPHSVTGKNYLKNRTFGQYYWAIILSPREILAC